MKPPLESRVAARYSLSMSREDLSGQTFGTWVVLKFAHYKNDTYWLCRCQCGVERDVRAGNLKRGTTKNCGCLREHTSTHGHARRSGKTRTYRIWKAMHSRVKPEYKQAKDYFGRGIEICQRWRSYQNFLADMGECPDGLSIDRINNDGNYEPENCRWADAGVQRRNSRRSLFVDFGGAALHLKDAALQIGVSDTAIYQEHKRKGGTIQEAFDRVARRHASHRC